MLPCGDQVLPGKFVCLVGGLVGSGGGLVWGRGGLVWRGLRVLEEIRYIIV